MFFVIFNLIKSAMFGNLTRVFISIFFIIIGILVFPKSSSYIMDKFDLHTKEMLKEKVKVQKEDIGRLMVSNKNLEQTLDLVEAEKAVEMKQIEEYFKNKEAEHKDVAKRIKLKAERIHKVNYATATSGKTISERQVYKPNYSAGITKHTNHPDVKTHLEENPDAPPTEADKQISHIQISAVWDTYCSFNANKSCSATKSI